MNIKLMSLSLLFSCVSFSLYPMETAQNLISKAKDCCSFVLPYPVIQPDYELNDQGVPGRYRRGMGTQDAEGTRFETDMHEDLVSDNNGEYFVNESVRNKTDCTMHNYQAATWNMAQGDPSTITKLHAWYRKHIGAYKLAFILHHPYMASATKYGAFGALAYSVYTKFFKTKRTKKNYLLGLDDQEDELV